MKTCGVYCIRNIVNNKLYIGSSVEIRQRWKNHIRDLKNNKHCNNYLQYAWNKYGEESFAFYIKEEVIFDDTLRKREGYWQDFYKSYNDDFGYNMNRVDENGKVHLSKETKKKISKANKGRERSEEYRQKISKTLTGKHHSEETKKKMSKARVGKLKGREISEEWRKKISDTLIEYYDSEDGKIVRQKKSEALKGKNGLMKDKHHSEESRQKMSKAQQKRVQDPNYVNNRKGKKHSEETKKKMSATRKRKRLERKMLDKVNISERGLE